LIWAAILIATPSQRIWSVCIAALGIVYAFKASLILQGADWLRIYFASDTRVDPIIWGCLTAALLTNDQIPKKLRQILATPSTGFILATLLGTLIFTTDHSRLYATQSSQICLWLLKMPCVYSSLSCLVLSCLLAPSVITNMLSVRPLLFIGRLSYSLYLYSSLTLFLFTHVPTTWAANHSLLLELGKIAVSVLLACGSYFLVEKPFLRMKKTMANKRSTETNQQGSGVAQTTLPLLARHFRISGD